MEQILGSTYDLDNKLVLGQGAHSVVYKVRHIDRDQYFAIKQFKKKGPQSQQSFRNQLECLKKLKHNNIIKLYSYFQEDDVAWEILEYCQSNLRKSMQICGQSIQMPQKEAVGIIRQIIQGMSELHRHSLIHRDLKPQNILIKDKVVKICDFGLTVYCSSTNPFTSYCGTPLYMSPQVASQQPYIEKADIWSLGVIFYQLLYGTPPWQFTESMHYRAHIRDNPLKFLPGVLISNWSKDFIEKCLEVDEKQRLDWEGVFAHPLVNLGNKMISQVQVLQANELVQALSDLYLKDSKEVQTRFFQDSYENSLNMVEFFKKVRKIYPDKQLTPRQSRLMFEKMDCNKNGKVTIEQLKKVLSRLNNSSLTISSIKQKVREKAVSNQIFSKAGIPEDTLFLDERQFESLVKTINPSLTSVQIRKLFERLDKDEDLKVGKNEVTQLFQFYQPPRLVRMNTSQSVENIPALEKLEKPRKSPMPRSRTGSRNMHKI